MDMADVLRVFSADTEELFLLRIMEIERAVRYQSLRSLASHQLAFFKQWLHVLCEFAACYLLCYPEAGLVIH
jgi:hypothetical protein